MKIALINIKQETNDFNPSFTTLRRFPVTRSLRRPAKSLRSCAASVRSAATWRRLRNPGLTSRPFPSCVPTAPRAGESTVEARQFFLDKIRAGLANAGGPIDALALQLHGACAAEGEDDVEGEQIALCREILGPDVPIVLSLDHHASVTRRMVARARPRSSATAPSRTILSTPAGSATKLLLRILTESLKPTMAWRRLPLLSHQEQFLTSKPPMKTWFDRARAMEAADPRVLQVAPLSDAAMARRRRGRLDGGRRHQRRPGTRRAAGRRDGRSRLVDAGRFPEEGFAFRSTMPSAWPTSAEKGVVMLSDTGDTVFGGAAGDSNIILESILRLGIKSTRPDSDDRAEYRRQVGRGWRGRHRHAARRRRDVRGFSRR